MSCAALGEAAALIASYENVVLDLGKTTLQVQGEQALMTWHAKHPAVAVRAMHDMIVAGWYCFAQWVVGIQQGLPVQVLFAHECPADIREYQKLFGVTPQFSAPCNGLLFDVRYLQLPIVQADQAFNRLMRQKADALMAQLAESGSLRERVVALLQSALPRQQATLAVIAAELALSERTLRRRLAEEHCSFQQLLAEVRTRLASLYLKDPALTLLDIALLLGYADQSSFTTAFKGWHGMTPGQWREDFGRK